MRAKALFGQRRLYLLWAVFSAAGLTVAAYFDPHIFGLAAFTAAFLSGSFVVAAAIHDWRSLPWAVLGCVPTAVAFAVLSTYNWA
jgi:hypothetical protein